VRRSKGDESGAALLIALIFIVILSVVVVAIIGFGGTGLRGAVAISSLRDVQHDVDAATEAAIQSIRPNQLAGTKDQTCPTFTSPAGSSGQTVTVTCEPVGNSGVSDDQPQFAIQTLGKNPGEGVHAAATGDVLNINGGVYSNGNITVTGSNGSMMVEGDVLARTSCPSPPTLVTTGLRHCPLLAGDPPGDDPNLGAAIAAPPTLADPPGTCTSSSSVVKFVPGYYSQIPSPGPGCTSGVWWFSPGPVDGAGKNTLGVYYFDFPDAVDCPGCTTKDAWALGTDTLIGGTPNGWTESTNASSIALPGACKADDPGGVQFIFGGPTSLAADSASGSIELCGAPAPSSSTPKQQIVLYGLKSGSRPSTGPTDLKPATASSPVGQFVSPDKALTIDGMVTTDSLVTKATPGTVTLSGFTTVPAGSLITAASLRIVHSESGGTEPKVTLGATGVPSFSPSYGLANSATLAEENVNILSDLNDLAWNKIDNLQVTYTASTNNNPVQSASLDGIWLRVTYKAPALEPTRCVAGSPGGCVPTAVSTKHVKDYLFRGTIYTPRANLDLLFHNKATDVYFRGIIANSLNVDVSASSKQSLSPFALPKGTAGRVVRFTATISGKQRLRAVVRFTDSTPPDASGKTRASPGFAVTVQSWAVLR
jgi:hypothetical protein